MAKYLSNRVRNFNIGVSSITESDTVLTAIGNTDLTGKVDIDIGSGTTAFEIQGSAGQLFSVTNNLTSGSIFSVNDVSGIPSIDVDANGTISLAPFGTNENVGVGISSPQEKLHVDTGTLLVTNTTAPQIRLSADNTDASDNDRTMLGQATASSNFVNTAVDNDTVLRGTSTGNLLFGVGTSEKLRITSDGDVGIGTASPSAKLHVEGISIATTLDTGGILLSDTTTKTYPTSSSFNVIAGTNINLELGTTQTVDASTPGGYNFVTADKRIYTKSAGTTSDIERLYFAGFSQSFDWTDANTCKQYVSFADGFYYAGINANGRSSSYFGANSIALSPPDGGTQSIANVNSPSLSLSPVGTSNVNITNYYSYSPLLRISNNSAGTKTVNITNASYYDTSQYWGTTGSTGTLNATITNLYGLRLRPPNASTGLTVTNNWGIYQEWSDATNYFAGNVGIGNTNPTSKLTVTGTASATALSTGASGTGINISTNTISGPATLTIDPAAVGDNTGTVVIAGDLQIDGTTTTVNSTTMTVDDKNIELGTGATNDAAADGGGITIVSGDGNKTFNFEATGDNLGSSENLNLASGKEYKIDNTSVLSATTLGTGVTGSSLTSVGTLGSLTVSGDVSISDKIIHTGDTNTAIRFPAADTFTIETAGSERVRVTSAGDVGIGTNNPSSNLEVSALSASDEPTIKVSSENSSIWLRTAGSSGSFPTGGVGNDGELVYLGGDFRFGIGTANKNLIFFNGSGYTERFRIGSSGQIGLSGANYGTSGQVITSNGTGSAPTWQDISPTTITVADESTDTTCFPLFATDATGSISPKTGSNLTFNSSNGTLTASTFSGSGANLTSLTGASAATYGDGSNVAQIVVDSNGRITGISEVSITGGGGGGVTVQDEGTPLSTTATTLNFVGDGVVASGTGATKTITISGEGVSSVAATDESSDTTCFPLFATSATGSVAAKTDASGLKYDSSNERLETTDVAVKGAVRYENSGSTERFEILYNETTDSLDFTYSAS